MVLVSMMGERLWGLFVALIHDVVLLEGPQTLSRYS